MVLAATYLQKDSVRVILLLRVQMVLDLVDRSILYRLAGYGSAAGLEVGPTCPQPGA